MLAFSSVVGAARARDLCADINYLIDYHKVQLNGGGIHCSTCPLIRDPVD